MSPKYSLKLQLLSYVGSHYNLSPDLPYSELPPDTKQENSKISNVPKIKYRSRFLQQQALKDKIAAETLLLPSYDISSYLRSHHPENAACLKIKESLCSNYESWEEKLLGAGRLIQSLPHLSSRNDMLFLKDLHLALACSYAQGVLKHLSRGNHKMNEIIVCSLSLLERKLNLTAQQNI